MSSFEKVQMIIADIMEVPINSVNINSHKNDFEKWDSLSQLNLVMEIEASFNISLDLEEMSLMNSVRDILNLIEKHTQKG
ncbi:acyl carrier protein [Paenibacillus sp. EC2-1]|uniref:acyl carrier protein n=1 Tax=Paenibacillus sp. EC2-1 TaxID=3388665 RepID=UPI003BEF02E6